MDRVSTLGLPLSGKMAAWNDLYSSRMSRVEFTPGDHHGFAAELSIGRLGPVKLAKLLVDRCSIERTPRHLAQSPRLYSLLLQARGSSTFRHYGHEAHLSEGDFVLCDTGMPHHFTTAGPSMTIMVRVAPEVMREYLPTLEGLCGHRLGRAVGVTGTVGAMVQSLTETNFGSCPEYETRVARHLLEMISISYSMGFDTRVTGSAAARRRRFDVIRYIEEHLYDPSLTVESVADGVHLSTRYVRCIFAEAGENVATYVRRRRLEECARKIREPAWSGVTLLKIAFSSGFNSAAHFTRCFRDQFGMSPREYRSQAALQNS